MCARRGNEPCGPNSDALRRTRPGRLRPCENPECALFLLDRSKPNKARWCSMAVCGNQNKARRYRSRHG
jgi:predicted RNA-binding Zn ribbon-like protein